MAWQGYILLELNGTLTAKQQGDLDAALKQISTGRVDLPDKIAYLRINVAQTKAIVKGEFPAKPTKADIVAILRAKFGMTQTQANAYLTFSVFPVNADPDYPDVYGGEDAVSALIQSDPAGWGETGP